MERVTKTSAVKGGSEDMAAARAERVAGGEDNALTPIPEETGKQWAQATPTRRNKSDTRGRSLSSGRIRMRGAVSGRLLPGEMRRRKKDPPSSAKRTKSKDAVVVAAVVKKPKRSFSAAVSGDKCSVEAEQLPPNTEAEAEPPVAASVQRAKAKTKLSKSERALKKAEAALARAKVQVDADISIKKKHKMRDERERQARERDAKALKVSPPCPPAHTRAHMHAPAHAYE